MDTDPPESWQLNPAFVDVEEATKPESITAPALALEPGKTEPLAPTFRSPRSDKGVERLL